MENYEGLIQLNPPLAVQGTVRIVPDDEGVDSIPFDNGLAVAFLPYFLEGYREAMECRYIVILPNGRMYEVSDHHITSAKPWTGA